MIRWQEADLSGFFGVPPVYEETGRSFRYEVSANGLRLLVKLFESNEIVSVGIFKADLPGLLFAVNRTNCTHAHITRFDGRTCLEAGGTNFSAVQIGITPRLAHGVRIFVDPHFQVETFEVNPMLRLPGR